MFLTLFWIVALIFSLALLVKSADLFSAAAEKIGLAFGLSSFIVGATIVSVGSSLPEIATAIITVLSDDSALNAFAVDTIIGSNIANCLLVGGISAIAVGTLKIKEQLIDIDLPFFFMSSAIFMLFIMDGSFTWQEGIVSIVFLAIFVLYTVFNSGNDVDEEVSSTKKDNKDKKRLSLMTPFFLLCVGATGIYFGADWTITSVKEVAVIFGIPTSIVTMIVVAIGTSLPELIISVQAALRGKHSIALGNIFGSNTFNALAVSGVPSFFGVLTVSDVAMKVGMPLFVVSTLAFIFTTSDDKIQKWEGYALIVLYCVFVGKLVGFF